MTTPQGLDSFIRDIGDWLRKGEPPSSVEEDLCGHALRTRLCNLQDADRYGRVLLVEALLIEIDELVLELYWLRTKNEKPRN